MEVLVAFVIMSIVLSALLAGQARTFGATTQTRADLLAYDLALSTIDLIGLERPFETGTTTVQNEDWTVVATVSESRVTSDGVLFYRVQVEVLGPNGRRLATAVSFKGHP